MSTLIDVAVSLQIIQTYLYKYVCPFTMILGTISCIMNLCVFTKKSLQKNPCSIYFIAYNVTNFIFIYTLYLSLSLELGYNIDLSSNNISICRLRLYSTILCNFLSPFYLILASIDRILVTSSNVHTRQRSTIRSAYLIVLIGTLFWALCHTHAIIFASLLQLAPNYFVCYFQLGRYLSFIGLYSLTKEITSVALLIILGLWSIRNVRQIGRVRLPSHTQDNPLSTTGRHSHSNQSKDRQLMRMLLLDTTIYASFSCLYGLFLLYQQITMSNVKSTPQQYIERNITNFCIYFIGIPYCTSFYCQLFISKTFRREVIKMLSGKIN